MTKTLVQRAKDFAREAHKGQRRKYTDLPYIGHPASVAALTWRYTRDHEATAAAWLHDTVEDCGVMVTDIYLLFGMRVARLVDLLTDRPDARNRAERKAELLARFERVQDGTAETIKLLDLLHNYRSISQHDDNFARKLREEARAMWASFVRADPRVKDLLAATIRSDEEAELQERLRTGIKTK